MDPAWYAHRERDTHEPLPWDHINSGVAKSYLRGQWKDVFTGDTVADCHHGSCNVCGMQKFDALGENAGVADCVVKLDNLVALRRNAKKFEGESIELV